MITRIILIVTAILIAVTAIGFGLAAGYMAAEAAVGSMAAAGIVAGALFLVALILVLTERIASRQPVAEQAAEPLGSAVGVLKTAVRQNPLQAMVLVTSLGFIAARRPGAVALIAERLSKVL
tara:strand:- start:2106 stop:2471 length:366 start_codon:yes stop_codon:yes gene_type:complete